MFKGDIEFQTENLYCNLMNTLNNCKKIDCICIKFGISTFMSQKTLRKVKYWVPVKTQNGCTQMLDTPTRITKSSQTLIDHVMHNKNWPHSKSQIESVDNTEYCAIHVSYYSSLEKSIGKTEKSFRFSLTQAKT